MRVFYKEGGWDNKVNFVDDNNVLLGYDNENDCCAQGGWFLSKNKDEWLDGSFEEKSMDLPGFNFDKEYIRKDFMPGRDEYEEGDGVQFRLVNGEDELFLTLYNFHNGYYSRGFYFSDKDKTIISSII